MSPHASSRPAWSRKRSESGAFGTVQGLAQDSASEVKDDAVASVAEVKEEVTGEGADYRKP